MQAVFKKFKPNFLLLYVLIGCAGTPPLEEGRSFENIVNEFLSEQDTITVLQDQNVVILSSNDPVTSEFVTVFQNELKKRNIADVVFSDHTITQKERDRQMSGLVNDDEIASITREKGAAIVIAFILHRVPGADPPMNRMTRILNMLRRVPSEKKIKIRMTAVYVEGNSIAASDIVMTVIPSHYDISRLPEEGTDQAAKVKKMSLAIIENHVKGIYNEP